MKEDLSGIVKHILYKSCTVHSFLLQNNEPLKVSETWLNLQVDWNVWNKLAEIVLAIDHSRWDFIQKICV
jgi:hypothetical protein